MAIRRLPRPVVRNKIYQIPSLELDCAKEGPYCFFNYFQNVGLKYSPKHENTFMANVFRNAEQTFEIR